MLELRVISMDRREEILKIKIFLFKQPINKINYYYFYWTADIKKINILTSATNNPKKKKYCV